MALVRHLDMPIMRHTGFHIIPLVGIVVGILFRVAKTGKDNGYTRLFDIESFDYSYYNEGSKGLKMALVHHLDMPIMRQTGFHNSIN